MYIQQKYEKFSGEGAHPLTQTLPPVGRGCPLPTSYPPRRLRYLDPSHSKILGTPLTAHRRQIQAVSTTMDANMLIVTAMISRRPRTLDHSRAASTSDAAAAVRDPGVSESGPSLDRSLADGGRSGTCHGPSGWSSDLDNAASSQPAPNALSCRAENTRLLRVYSTTV